MAASSIKGERHEVEPIPPLPPIVETLKPTTVIYHNAFMGANPQFHGGEGEDKADEWL